jgi:Tol biopolymer transport system component/pimeloyl-ACP methyl ester carboxylesterase
MRSRSHLVTLALLVCLAIVLPASAAAATNGPILFQGATGKRPQTFRINPDGTGLKQLTHAKGEGAENAVWSPDGSAISYDVGAEGHADVFTAHPDGTGAVKLPLGASKFHGDPAYSPDGSQISYDEDSAPGQPVVHGIFVANKDGSGARRLTTALAGKDAFDTESQWSPDGTRIAFTRVKNPKDAAIFVVNTDGTGLKQLTPYKLDAASPDWSPDGTRIAFNTYWDPHPGKSANVYTVHPDGTGMTAITRHRGGKAHSFRPSWAPDGTKLVIARFVPKGKRGRLDLFIINPDGSGAKRLTNSKVAFAAQADWGPGPAPASLRALMARGETARTAATAAGPCDDNPDVQCGTVDVPRDRSHPDQGTIPIAYRLYPRTDTSKPALDPIFATEGGPGYSITQNNAFAYDEFVFAPLRDRHDFVAIDQRGVGLSDAIDCSPLQHGVADTELYSAVSTCAAFLGPFADEYGTGDVALDVEAVRKALGVNRFMYYGASYSGVDVQAYAARFPSRLSAVVLDSPTKIVNFDPFFTPAAAAMARSVDLVCARSASCSADHRRASEDLAWLTDQLRRHPVDGTGIDAVGNAHALHVTEGFLANRITYNDGGAFVSDAELAAAATSLRQGDAVPLLRLAADADGPFFGDNGDPRQFSAADNVGRFCTDATFAWDKSAPISVRRRQFERARDQLRRNTFAPFSVDAWLSSPPDGLQPDPCITWPTPEPGTQPAVPPRTRFADIPALVLSGDLDLNVTTAEARDVAALFPKSRFVELTNSGHHTAFSWRSACSQQIIQTFLATLKPGDTSCAKDLNVVFPAVGRFPATADDARPADADSGGDHSTKTDRKVATVAAATFTDSLRRAYMTGEDGPGLRGGTFDVEFTDTETNLDLSAARYAGDVTVTGHASVPFDTNAIDAQLAVDGPGAEDGSLHLTGVWLNPNATTLRIQGTLGGRTVSLSVPAT